MVIVLVFFCGYLEVYAMGSSSLPLHLTTPSPYSRFCSCTSRNHTSPKERSLLAPAVGPKPVLRLIFTGCCLESRAEPSPLYNAASPYLLYYLWPASSYKTLPRPRFFAPFLLLLSPNSCCILQFLLSYY